MQRKIIIFILLLLTFTQPSRATQYIKLSQSAQIYLLTCTPGSETYSKYGHSAIRLLDDSLQIDYTFNYGVFDFSTPHFYSRFVSGNTVYQLAVQSTPSFLRESSLIGRTTYSQLLNLTSEQKQDFADALFTNYEPQNRFYLYNFVFDNCATRPYHLLRNTISQPLATPQFDTRHDTFRSKITHYSEPFSWPGFAINFVFGKDADQVMTKTQRLFLPEELMDYVAEAHLPNGEPLVTKAQTQPFVIRSNPWYLSPEFFIGLLTILIFVITAFDTHRHKISWWFDATLFFLGGLLGSIAFYLTFFSRHPLVGHNFNLLLINPLLFILFICCLTARTRKYLRQYAPFISLVIIILFIARVFISQTWHLLLLIPLTHALRIANLSPQKNILKINRKAVVIALLLLAPTLNAAQSRLTIVALVDGLNQDALNQLRPYWQQGGLRTLDEEAHKSTVSFSQLVYGGTETAVTMLTGQMPQTHGIAADYYFNRANRQLTPIYQDAQAAGIGTDLTISPRAILSPTVTDLMRIKYADNAKIYAIGITPLNTIALAGHAANQCAWLDPVHMRWVTTNYYTEGLPADADQMNIDQRIEQLAERQWTPRMNINMYMHPTDEEKKKSFAYSTKQVLCQSPTANTLVIELALNMQQTLRLGQTASQDMLLLELNLTSPNATSDCLNSAEQEDMYLCLNQDLGFLIEQLDKRLGKSTYQLIVVGKPKLGQDPAQLNQANLNLNFFNTERAAALINTYMMALYGHERWIDGAYGQQIFLNRTLIEQKKMSLVDLQRQVADFLLQFEGVQQAYAATDLPLVCDDATKPLKNSHNKLAAGDVSFTLQPLWIIGENIAKRIDYVIEPEPIVPLLLYTQERRQMPPQNISATQVFDIITNK